ncbi:MAG: FAD-dependent oxidoreductase [bacterium]|jgi:hypothetical protein
MKYKLLDKNSQVIGEYDVDVCGGGPAGCATALSARRTGLELLMVENQGQLWHVGVNFPKVRQSVYHLSPPHPGMGLPKGFPVTHRSTEHD